MAKVIQLLLLLQLLCELKSVGIALEFLLAASAVSKR